MVFATVASRGLTKIDLAFLDGMLHAAALALEVASWDTPLADGGQRALAAGVEVFTTFVVNEDPTSSSRISAYFS